MARAPLLPGLAKLSTHGAHSRAHAQPAGCITSHTSMRRSAGIHKPRPGIHHLHRLKVWGPLLLPGVLGLGSPSLLRLTA